MMFVSWIVISMCLFFRIYLYTSMSVVVRMTYMTYLYFLVYLQVYYGV